MVLTVQENKTRRALPDGWRWARLGELIAEARNGLYKPDGLYGRGVPILKMFNIGRLDGKWVTDRVDLVEVDAQEEQAYRLETDDILVNRVNSRELVGKCAVVDRCVAGAVFESKNMRLRLNTTLADSSFVAAWLNSAGGRSQIAECLKQIVGQATVNRTDLNAVLVPLPPVAQQRRITDTLNEQMATVGRARAAAEAQLGAAKALPAAYIRESFTEGPSQHVSLARCLSEVSKGVGQNWPRYRLVGATRAGIAPAKEEMGKAPERYKLVDEGTIFYNPMRILLGSIAFVDEGDEPGVTSPDYVVFKTVKGLLQPRWFYYWLRSSQGEAFIKTLTRGAVRERMLFRRLVQAEVKLPPRQAQEEAGEKMRSIKPLTERIAQ